MLKINPMRPRSLRWWYSQRHQIDFNPPFQRYDNVWSVEDKAYLIDSILNDYDLPKFYLADFNYLAVYEKFRELNVNRKPYAIIDGKQRFQAIFDFFEDKIALKSDFVYYDDISLKLGKMRFSNIQRQFPQIANAFEGHILDVVSVITDDPTEINELFLRLNHGRKLNQAELRRAMRGVVPKLIQKIGKHKFFKKKIKFSTRRKQDENVASKLLLLEFRGRFVDLSDSKIKRLIDEGVRSETSNFKMIADEVVNVLDEMCLVFEDRDKILSNPKRIPIYYWIIRNYGADPSLRQFLISFENEREKNRQIVKKGHQANQELLYYELMEADSNTVESLRARYNTLERWFLEYRKV